MTDQEIIDMCQANAHVSAAISTMLHRIILCLAQQPSIDKELLKKHLEMLPDPNGDDALTEVYSKIKSNLLQDLS